MFIDGGDRGEDGGGVVAGMGGDSTEMGERRDTSVVGGRVGIRRWGRSYDQGGVQGDGWRGWTRGAVVTERWGRAWGVMGR